MSNFMFLTVYAEQQEIDIVFDQDRADYSFLDSSLRKDLSLQSLAYFEKQEYLEAIAILKKIADKTHYASYEEFAHLLEQ